jgi:hypothetical protein
VRSLSTERSPFLFVFSSLILLFAHFWCSWCSAHCDSLNIFCCPGDIAESIIFRRKVKESGQYPDKSLGDAVCSEIYDCDEEDSNAKKSSKKKGKKRSSARDEFR